MDPFELAFKQQQEEEDMEDDVFGGTQSTDDNDNTNNESTFARLTNTSTEKNQDDDDDDDEEEEDEEEEEEEENMDLDLDLGKIPSSNDPEKMAKMKAIFSKLNEDQLNRFEAFRRSGFQKPKMKKLLSSITGIANISPPMTIVVCTIAKMFVGELVETGRLIMKERQETGPLRPCHIREAYRRLKFEGKVPKR